VTYVSGTSTPLSRCWGRLDHRTTTTTTRPTMPTPAPYPHHPYAPPLPCSMSASSFWRSVTLSPG